MTVKNAVKDFLGLPAAAIAVVAILYFLLQSAFVPQSTFRADQARQDLATDSLRSSSRDITRYVRQSWCVDSVTVSGGNPRSCVQP